MTPEIQKILQDLLKKEDNLAYEEAMQKAVALYDIKPENRHPAKEIRAIGETLLQHDDDLSRVVKGIVFNNVAVPIVNGIATFNQSSATATYGIILASDTSTSATHVVRQGDAFKVRIRYTAIVRSTLGVESVYNDQLGRLEIRRRSGSSSNFDVLDVIENIRAVERDAPNYNVEIDLAPYFRTGDQQFNLVFTVGYTDENNVDRTVSETLSFVVNSINLSVKNRYNFLSPIDASTGTFPVEMNVFGSVRKYLHLKITGATQYGEYSQVVTIDENKEGELDRINIVDNALYGLTNHGVHTIEAWLTCDDGSGSTDSSGIMNGMESDHIITRVMVVNAAASLAQLTQPYLLLQEVTKTCTNYVRADITTWGYWRAASAQEPLVASSETIDVRVLITDYSENDSDYGTVYREIEQNGARVYQAYNVNTTIEIEDGEEGGKPQYITYLRIMRLANGGRVNMMLESNLGFRTVAITVDNTQSYSPTAGAYFYLNPKTRSNSEEDWQTIINENSPTRALIASTWRNIDRNRGGWQTDKDGVPVLRIPAGGEIVITGLDPYEKSTDNPQFDLSIEIIAAMRNVTNLNDRVVSICEDVSSGDVYGLAMRPLDGTLTCASEQSEQEHNFRWQEDTRTNFIIVHSHAVKTDDDDISKYVDISQDTSHPYEDIPLSRVYINGVCNRGFQHPLSRNAWETGRGRMGGIKLGQEGCDLDIYAIRIYDSALSTGQIKQNVTSGLPTSEEKEQMRFENDICLPDGRISKQAVETKLKRNTLTFHGETDIWKGNVGKKITGYLEIHVYDPVTGEEDKERGGTIGKDAYTAYLNKTLGTAKAYTFKSQGSTAETYYWSNGQGKTGDCTYRIRVPWSKIHSDFGWKAKDSNYTADSPAKYPMYYNGEQIQGDNFLLLTEAEKALVVLDVFDGWIDWNGMYHGNFWKPSRNGAKAKKLCWKINYASSMAHHKMGATNMFHDVMHSVLAKNGALSDVHKADAAARFAVEELPFFYFHQGSENGQAYYHGPATFGSAKGDKPTWGFDDKKYPHMTMFEGSDNNNPLTDFRIPYDDDVFFVHTDDDDALAINNSVEGISQQLQMDFDLGLTREETGEATTEAYGKEAPTQAAVEAFARFCNFVYTHNTRIECFNGSIAALQARYDDATSAEKETMRQKQYWCTDDYCLYRFRFANGQWVDAGTWDQDNLRYVPGKRNLSTDPMTRDVVYRWEHSSDYGLYDVLNHNLRLAIAEHARLNLASVACVPAVLTHYNLVNFAMIGTDNCSKNTYYVFLPVTVGGVTKYMMYMYGDDLDTIFITDNNGASTKLWWVERMHDMEDYLAGRKPHADYEGKNSVFFNMIEDAFDANLEQVTGVSGKERTMLQDNMRDVLDAIREHADATDGVLGYEGSASTLVGAWHKYFLQYTKYFPMVAYNEAGRIRYEYPKALGFRSYGKGNRHVDPITQHMGDQREAEMDCLYRRSVLLAMYAAWGDFGGAENYIGIPEAAGQFGISHATGQPSTPMIFTLKADRPFYPIGLQGESVANPHVRVMPGQTYTFNAGTVSNDRGGALCGINYYSEIGNIGDFIVHNDKAQSVGGNRLTKLEVNPTGATSGFAPSSLIVSAPNLTHISFNGAAGLRGTIDLSKCTRLNTLDAQGSNLSFIQLPQTQTLRSVYLPAATTQIESAGHDNLEVFRLEGASNLQRVHIDHSHDNVAHAILPMLTGEGSPTPRRVESA